MKIYLVEREFLKKISCEARLIFIIIKKLDMNKYIKGNTVIKVYINNKNKLTIKNAKKMYKEMGAKCK